MFRTALISLFLTSTALATTWTVDDDGKADFDNIQAAVDASSDGDEIIVMPGTYTSTQDGHVVNMLGKAVTLRSSDPTDPDVVAATIIDGENTRRGIACFNEETSSTLIDGFTITNGFADVFDYDGDSVIDWFEEGGGGLICWKSSPSAKNCVIDNNHVIGAGLEGGGAILVESNPSLQNCVLSNNSASWGGAMYCWASSPSIIDCSFINNNASSAGGIRCKASSNLTLTNTIFINNTVDNDGGAIHCDTSAPTLTNCTFTGNTATFGGGMYNNNSNPTLNNGCTFTDNTATFGGGMYNNNSNPTLNNGCTFTDNTATSGGGMYSASSNPTLTDCTFTGNDATNNFGGGMLNVGSSPTLTDCRFENNTAIYYGGGMYNTISSPTLTGCAFTDNTVDAYGGGMYNHNSSPTLTDCTFENNTAYYRGGGMYNYKNSSPTLTDCSLTGNSATTGDGIYNVYDSSTYFIGTNISDELYIDDVSSLDFGAESTCDVFGSTYLSSDGTISFDIDDIETSSSLNVSESIDLVGGLVVSNNTGSLLDLLPENIGDRIPLAQASTLTGNFDSIVFPLMPEGLGLQLINPALRGGGSEVAAEVIEVAGANFDNPFSGDLDSPPIDIISFDADGDGRDEVAVLFGGTPGGVACYSVSEDGAPTLIDGYAATLGDDPVDLDAGDLNGDGLDDLLVVDGESATLTILVTEESGGSLTFVESTFKGSDTFTCVAMTDWGGDSVLDAVVGVDVIDEEIEDGYQIYFDVSLFASIGPWLEIPDYQLPNNSYEPDPPTCVDGGNLSGDWGFVGGTRYGRVHRGTSGDSLQVISELVGNNIVTIEAIELDLDGGDGQIDLMVSSDEAEAIYLYQGNAAESDGFDDLIPLGVALPVEDIIAIDADYDGDIDIVMTAPDSTSSWLTLLRNDGAAGGFVGSLAGLTWSKQAMNSGNPLSDIEPIDVNDDKDIKQVIVGAGDATNLRGEPAGTLEQTNLLGDINTCDPDINGDGYVNVSDLLVVIDQWGLTDSPADVNQDGIVDVSDLLIVVGNWGPCE